MIEVLNNNHWIVDCDRKFGEYAAVITDSKIINYHELFSLVQKSALQLKFRGIKEKDHVAIIAENRLEFIVAMHAIWLIGAIPVPLNKKSNVEEINNFLNLSDSSSLILLSPLRFKEKLKNIVIIQFELASGVEKSGNFSFVEYKSDSTAVMMFTSGSSGIPKCVLLSFNNLFYSANSIDKFINHNKKDIWLATLPFNHIGGFSIIIRALLSGCSLSVPNFDDQYELYSSIDKNPPTLISLVPEMFNNLLESRRKPWPNLRHLFIGGAKVSEKLVVNGLKNTWPISYVYGSTETSSMVSLSSRENLLHNGLSSGKPLNGVKLRIEKGKNKETSGGRIIVKSKSVTNKYYNSTEENIHKLSEGEFRSNDLGYIDERDNLHVIGRMDNVIISGGENISLIEIENLLNSVNNLSNCVAIPIKNKKWGQSYIIVTDSGNDDIETKVMEYLEGKLARFKLPQKIYKIEKLPKNEMGKIQLNEIKKIINFDSI